MLQRGKHDETPSGRPNVEPHSRASYAVGDDVENQDVVLTRSTIETAETEPGSKLPNLVSEKVAAKTVCRAIIAMLHT